jgi:hypothetical protein
MKMYRLKFLTLVVLIAIISSCTTLNKTMREPNTRVELSKNDFTLSDQVSADAQTTKIFGIDFARIFMKRTGTVEGAASVSVASIPVIGNLMIDKTANYSLYQLMSNNPGFDVVFYPQYETKIIKPIFGIGILTKITSVKTTARLGRLNK